MSNTLNSRANELSRYITSHGSEVPTDYLRFIKGAEFENSCVFCGLEDDGFYVYRYNIIEESRKKLEGVCSCKVCQKHINDMLMVYYPTYYEMDMFNTGANTGNHIDFQEHEEIKNKRITDFLTERKFDNRVDEFYLHLDFISDLYTKNRLCYFCETTHWGKYYEIEVPMSESWMLDGGKVPCCRHCGEERIKDLREDNLDVVSTLCPKCDKKYLITKGEYLARKSKNSIGKHLCSSCVYKSINNLSTNTSVIYYEPNSPARENPVTRFITITCSVCGEDEHIDLTLDHKLLARKHSIDRVTRKFRCSICYILGTSRANGNKFHIKVRDSYYIIFTRVGKYWNYTLVQVKGETLTTIMTSPKDLYLDDDTDIGFIAYEEAIKLLNSKQKELWEEL